MNTNNAIMKDYVIATDSGADLPYDLMEREGIMCADLTLYFEATGEKYSNREVRPKELYERLRNGEIAKTSAVNPEEFREAFEPVIKSGKDILYIGLDSAISTTYGSARIAAESLNDEYSENRIVVIDTLCACGGLGLLVYEAVKLKKGGAGLDEIANAVMKLAPKVSHRFTVETLTYLNRGGRVSKSSCVVGNVLNIKPVLRVDDAGYLVSTGKARGRRKSIEMLVDAYENTADNSSLCTTVISHADCIDDARKLANILKEHFNVKDILITDIGPVIGAHAGPGTLALFYKASAR